MIIRLARSLSFRLLAIFLLMGVLFAYGAVLGIRWVYVTDDLRELISGHLTLHVNYVRDDIGNPPSIDKALAITQQVPVDIRIEGPNVSWASDSNFPTQGSLTFGDSEVFDQEAQTWLQDVEGVDYATTLTHGFLRIRNGDYAVIVSTPKIADQGSQRQLMPIIMGFGLFLVLLAYLAVRWLFRPVEAIRLGAAEIGRGNFDHRIEQVRQDQLGDLAKDINKMATDVQRMLDAKRQLLLGISHELRTPLSRLKLGLELVEDETATRGLQNDVDEMDKIIAMLLEGERLNTGHVVLSRSEEDAGQLLRSLISDFFKDQQDVIDIQVPDDLQINVDPIRFNLMIKNLISNGLRHADPEGPNVAVTMEPFGNNSLIRVMDNGKGFPKELKAFVGEPFFRGDPSRTRNTGGTGLGLYLARLVAEAHGGDLTLDENRTGSGACFLITLPDTVV